MHKLLGVLTIAVFGFLVLASAQQQSTGEPPNVQNPATFKGAVNNQEIISCDVAADSRYGLTQSELPYRLFGSVKHVEYKWKNFEIFREFASEMVLDFWPNGSLSKKATVLAFDGTVTSTYEKNGWPTSYTWLDEPFFGSIAFEYFGQHQLKYHVDRFSGVKNRDAPPGKLMYKMDAQLDALGRVVIENLETQNEKRTENAFYNYGDYGLLRREIVPAYKNEWQYAEDGAVKSAECEAEFLDTTTNQNTSLHTKVEYTQDSHGNHVRKVYTSKTADYRIVLEYEYKYDSIGNVIAVRAFVLVPKNGVTERVPDGELEATITYY